MTQKTLSYEDIKKILPHRYPFLLVDRVLLVSEESIEAIKNVTANEHFFVGHFPGMAVMPGVLQIEAMAQAAGLILAANSSFLVDKEIAFLAGVDEARFKRIVVPGDQLKLEAKVIARKKSIFKVKASASVLGNLASSAVITLVTKPL